MKKSSLVVLTIVAALAISSCAVQKTAENFGPPDPVYAEQITDTTKSAVRDTTIVQYNYYYRSYFWDNMYRTFCPRRYYAAINRHGFVPKHLRNGHARGDTAHNRTPSSPRRGGFGHHGTSHTPVS